MRQSVQVSLNKEKKSTGRNSGQPNNINMNLGMRNRTNSLINSCSSEVNFKMKFIRDMPNNNNNGGQSNYGPSLHKRIPSN